MRAIKELGDAWEHVASHLGPDVKLELEVRATSEVGYDDATQRTVSENAAAHGAIGSDFLGPADSELNSAACSFNRIKQ